MWTENDFRFPYEWQQVKEQMWSNPLFAAAAGISCLSVLGCFHFSLAFLCSEVLATYIFQALLRTFGWVSGTATPGRHLALQGLAFTTPFPRALGLPSAVGGGTGRLGASGSSATLARYNWALAFLGMLVNTPPAMAVAWVFALHSTVSLGKPRLDALTPVLACIVAWSLGGAFVFAGLSHTWELSMCRRMEEQRDAVCQNPTASMITGYLCYLETAAECEFILLAIYAYGLATVMSLAASVLGYAGVVVEHRRLRERWPALKRAEQTHAASERWALLS